MGIIPVALKSIVVLLTEMGIIRAARGELWRMDRETRS